jgi:predicted nucleotidyltransferase
MSLSAAVFTDLILTEREETAVDDFIARLRTAFADKLHGVVLYGSKVRSDATADSDIDLLIIMDSDDWPTRDAVTQIASRVSLACDLLLSTHVVSLSRWQAMVDDPFTFYQNLFAEGVALFGDPTLFAPLHVTPST